MKKSLYILFMVFFSFTIYAQNLHKFSGIVVDSLTKEPLVGASVNLNFGYIVLHTDKNGRFYIDLQDQKNLVVVVKSVGYKTWRTQLDFNQEANFDVKLLQVSHDLEEVIVSSAAQESLVKRPVLGINTLSIKTLEKLPSALGELDILRGLQMLPGVTSVGEAANGLNIRGGATDQNLILLDDSPIFNPTHMFGLFSAFPSEAVNNLDLYKGNVPARLGGRAAAVLDVRLVNPSLEKTKLTAGISFVSEHFKLETPIIKDKLSILIAGRASFNDFLFPIISKDLADVKANFGDGTFKLFYKFNNKSTFSYTGYFSQDFFQTTVLGSIKDINSINTQYAYKTFNNSLSWFYALNDKLNFQTKLVTSNYNPKIILPELNSSNKVNLHSGIIYKQLKSNLNFNQGIHKIESGLDLIKYEINPGELNPGINETIKKVVLDKENALETAIYIEDEIQTSSKITASFGIRYSYFMSLGSTTYRTYLANLPKSDETVTDIVNVGKGKVMQAYGGLEPRVALKYQINPDQSIKFGYNLMRQYLQLVTNTTTPLPTSRWKTSDKYIQPQISSLLTLGYFKDINEKIYEFSVEAYFRKTNNIIDYKPGADFLLQKYPETQLLQGLNHSYGLEFMISKKKGAVKGWLNYTYSKSLNKVNDGLSATEKVNFGNWYRANYDRPHLFNAEMVINQTKHHDFSFNFTFSSGRPYTLPLSFITFQDVAYPFYGERNNARMQSYHRLDFSWNIYNPNMKVNQKWQGNWNFTIYNLYGRKNAYSVFLTSNGTQVTANKLIVFGFPIFSLAYKLKFE